MCSEELILTSAGRVVSDPEDVWLHAHSPPLRTRRVLSVLTEARLEVAVGDGGVKGQLWRTNRIWLSSFQRLTITHIYRDGYSHS